MIKRHMKPGPATSGGFTLLEVLLAFVVFALSFAIVLEILGGAMRSTMRARDYSQAALIAQSLMDMVGTEMPLMESSLFGETVDGYRWTIDVTTFDGVEEDQRALELADMNGTMLYWVDLRLEWGEEPRIREIKFSTVRSMLEGVDP